MCPVCSHGFHEKLRCVESAEKKDGCVLTKLEQTLDVHPEANVLGEVREIENLIALKITVTPNDIRSDVFPALVILNEERERYDREHRKT